MVAARVDRRRRSPPKPSTDASIHIFTDDVEIKLIQGFVNGMHHISERHLTLRHLKIIMVVYLIGKAFNGQQPDAKMIAAIGKVAVEDLQPELTELVDKRYLVEQFPRYGDVKLTYKLGSMGGTLMRHVCGSASGR